MAKVHFSQVPFILAHANRRTIVPLSVVSTREIDPCARTIRERTPIRLIALLFGTKRLNQ